MTTKIKVGRTSVIVSLGKVDALTAKFRGRRVGAATSPGVTVRWLGWLTVVTVNV